MKKLLAIIVLALLWCNTSFSSEIKMAGTTWAFSPLPADDLNPPYQIQFYDAPKCKHVTSKDNDCIYYLGYKNKLHIIINNYSLRIGTISNKYKIFGKGSNVAGEKWKFEGIKTGSEYKGFTVE